MHTIPILGTLNESDLSSLGGVALPAGARIAARPGGAGVHMDPATLALVINASKEVLVAAMTMLGTVWAAKIAARAKSDAAPPAAQAPSAAIEIETVTDSHLVVISEDLEERLRGVVPDRVERVLTIRLRNVGSR